MLPRIWSLFYVCFLGISCGCSVVTLNKDRDNPNTPMQCQCSSLLSFTDLLIKIASKTVLLSCLDTGMIIVYFNAPCSTHIVVETHEPNQPATHVLSPAYPPPLGPNSGRSRPRPDVWRTSQAERKWKSWGTGSAEAWVGLHHGNRQNFGGSPPNSLLGWITWSRNRLLQSMWCDGEGARPHT